MSYEIPRHTTGRSLAVPVAALITLAGCSPEQTADVAPDQLGISAQELSSPTDRFTRDLYDVNTVRFGLLQYKPDMEKLEGIVFSMPDGSVVRAHLQSALDSRTSEQIIDDMDDSVDPLSRSNALVQAETVHDPISHQELVTAIDLQTMETTLQTFDTSYKPISYDEARAGIMELPDSPQRQAVFERLQLIQSKNIFERLRNQFLPDHIDAATARAEVAAMNEPILQGQMETEINDVVADDILTGVLMGDVSKDEAAAEARAEISDPTVQEDVVNAAVYADEPGAYSEYSRIALSYNDYINPDSELGLRLSKSALLASEISLDVSRAKSGMDSRVIEETGAAELAVLSPLIRENSAATRSAVPYADAPFQEPGRTIDLSAMDDTKEVPDWPDRFKNGVEQSTLQQFAEIYMQDGSVVVAWQQESGISAGDQQALQDSIDRNVPLLAAAFNSGNLVSVRLTVGTDYDPLYAGGPREIIMALPDNNSTSIDQFNAGLTHETIHALTRNITAVSEDGIDQSQAVAIDAACTQIRTISYDRFEASATAASETLAGLAADVKPEHRPIVSALEDALKNGSFDTMITSLYHSDSRTYDNNCEYHTFGDIFYAIAKEAGFSGDSEEIAYILKDPNAEELISLWVKAIDYNTVYTKINESNFVTTEYSEKYSIGHAQDNTDELVASLLDTSINYPDELRATLAAMSEDEHAAAVAGLTASLDIVRSQNPDLTTYFNDVQSKILG